MRNRLLGFTAMVLCLAAPAVVADSTTARADDAAAAALIQTPRGCGRVGSSLDAAPEAGMIMVEGFGTGTWKVDTDSAEAQAWFNHGVRLRWAFEHSESVRAFRKARALDPDCGLCAWGEAWALGPNLNGGGTDEASMTEGRSLAQLARRRSRDATALQRQMIDALIQRYSGSRASRGVRFARAMDRVQRRSPDDPMIAAVAADAWMLQADEWWDDEGRPRDHGIVRAMSILEDSLARSPDDPGTIHLYIHLTEWSDDPHKAIPYGERLGALAPSASHLVHMPSHTFYRVGRYRDAMQSNVNAVRLDKRYNELAAPPGGIVGMPLHGHNLHFGMGGALMAGGAEEGLALAQDFLTTYPEIAGDAVWRQLMANDAYAIFGRFGTAGQVAALGEPPADRPLLRASWRYGRGEAAARAGNAAAVRAEAQAIRAIRDDPSITGENARDMKDFMEVSQRVLEGRAAMIEGNASAAIAAFTRAAEIQAQDPEGGDPPIIWYPTRRSLAAAMLANGDAAGAKAKVEELLTDWPMDPYSYFVLAEAEAALGHTAAAEAARARAGVEWVGGEMSLKLA
jgi:tetratricopeptide (TPR) repeat protein